MSLATSNRMEQQAAEEAVRCAEYFAKEVLETIDDMETLGTLLDAMEFFHSICNGSQFYTILQILHEALDIPMPDFHYYFKDSLLSDLFFSCFTSELVVAVMNEIGGDDI